MIQKEISELRRHMTPERTNMTHIYGCYVNGEKQIISSNEQSLAVMEKNDVEKYIELMKKALSGKIGRLKGITAKTVYAPEEAMK